MTQSLEEQAKLVIRLLQAKRSKSEAPLLKDEIYLKAIEWARLAPGKLEGAIRQELITTICETFGLSEVEIVSELAGVEVRQNGDYFKPKHFDEESQLEALLPKGGYFETYIEYTRYNEAPMSYHVVSSLVALGCAVGRRCFVDMGHFKIFGAVNAILIGPTGVVHKSTAVDIAKELIVQATLCPVMADSFTGEKLMTNLVQSAQQFIPAGELSVLFGRQKYLEGLTKKILKLLDYPSEMANDTVARNLEIVVEPTISILGGSTMSLLMDSTPEEVLSSGFLNRFLVVVETGTHRIFPRPKKPPLQDKLIKILQWVKNFTGEITLSEDSPADQIYVTWYRQRAARIQQDHAVAEVTQRGHIHLLRLAMLIHIVECNTLTICEKCMSHAIALLAFIERKAPELIRAIHSNTQTSQTDYVVETLKKLGGAADHSTLLRRVSSRINTTQLKQVIATLSESGLVRTSAKGIAQWYILRSEKEEDAHS